MSRNGRTSIIPILTILVALILALAFLGCESPTAPGPSTNNGLGGTGAIDPGASGAFLLGAVSDSTIGPGSLEIWAMNVAFHDSTGMVTFDVQILNRTQRTIAPPIRFVITSVTPKDVSVVDFDGVSQDDFPFYDFSAKLGTDNVLTPGERTERVTMKFHTVTARSFAIGFRIDIGPPAGLGTIGGVVFNDTNEDGERDRECRCEPGIPGITVALERTLENGDRVLLLTKTDENGEYRFTGNKEGVHKVFVHAPENLWRVTSANPLLVTLVKDADGKVQDFLGANFGLVPLIQPAVTLFGPIFMGTPCPLITLAHFGTEVDSTFVNPPSPLTVVYKYYLSMMDWSEEGRETPWPDNGQIDSVSAWINNVLVFTYPPDSSFVPSGFPEYGGIQLPDGLVTEGENTIRLTLNGGPCAVLSWEVFKRP